MKIDVVGVTSSDMEKTVEFYKLLGFTFGEFKSEDDHLEPTTPNGSARLMIDKKGLIKEILGEEPKPSNHSSFAIQYDSSKEINNIAEKVKESGFKIVREPWNAFWGQRYCIVEDPDGYKVDLYCNL
ncbi:MAG: VOC family protein [Candidatus Dojkabacteria bacterium]